MSEEVDPDVLADFYAKEELLTQDKKQLTWQQLLSYLEAEVAMEEKRLQVEFDKLLRKRKILNEFKKLKQ